MPGHKVNRRRGLWPVEQAAPAADFLDLLETLRHREIVERRETDPVTRQRHPIQQGGDKLRLLRITKAAIGQIKLPGCILLGDEQAGRFCEKLLQVVVHHRSAADPA